jgi:toxin ParE1/3/4
MKHVIFHPQAEAEYDEAIGFYEEKQRGLGFRLEKEIIRILSGIVEDPLRWPIYKFGLRKCVLTRFPYKIFYLLLSDYIWVVAVAHGSRRPDYWQERLVDRSILS